MRKLANQLLILQLFFVSLFSWGFLIRGSLTKDWRIKLGNHWLLLVGSCKSGLRVYKVKLERLLLLRVFMGLGTMAKLLLLVGGAANTVLLRDAVARLDYLR